MESLRRNLAIYLLYGVLVILALIVAASVIAQPFVYWYKMHAFLDRAGEADTLIDAVYSHYFTAQRWPETLNEIKKLDKSKILPGWEYVVVEDPVEVIKPLLRISGPLHMKLEYEFRKDGDPNSPGGWAATMEGDPVRHQFREVIPEKPAARILEQ
jgi:hypothetical protein